MDKIKLTFAFLMAILISGYVVFAQNNPESEINISWKSPDSLLIADSLIVADTLQIFQSLNDSITYIDIPKLKGKIDSLILVENTAKPLLPFLLYRENFHLFAPFSPDLIVKKNGFSDVSYFTTLAHQIQNNIPFNRFSFDEDVLFFNDITYSLSPALVYTEMALGANDMNHVLATFRKGNILGINSLHANVGFLAQDGFMATDREKSKNLNIHLWSQLSNARIHYFFNNIDQEIPRIKLISNSTTVSEKITENSIIFQNKLINLGLKNQSYRLADKTRNLTQLFVSKEINVKSHYFKPEIEYIWEDNKYSIYSLEHCSKIKRLTWQNYIFYKNEFNFSSNLYFRVFKQIRLRTLFKHIYYDKIGMGIDIDKGAFSAVIGEMNEKNFAEVSSFRIWNIQKAIIEFQVWMRFYENPVWQRKAKISLQYDIHHGNALILGTDAIYSSEYDSVEYTFQLDAFTGIQITPRFIIMAELKNITNDTYLFGEYNNPIRLNVKMHWMFVN